MPSNARSFSLGESENDMTRIYLRSQFVRRDCHVRVIANVRANAPGSRHSYVLKRFLADCDQAEK